MKNFALRTRILTSFLLAGLIPMLAVAIYARQHAADSLKESVSQNFEAQTRLRSGQILRYFKGIEDQILIFSHEVSVVDATKAFREDFKNVIEENDLKKSDLAQMRQSVLGYYRNEFGKEYKSQNGSDIDVISLVKGLSDAEVALQYYYISNNENALGSKDLLNRADDKSNYSANHEKYHPSIQEFLKKFGYYDVFLVDIETGNIIYSVFKELDYATSLLSGSYADTNFAEAFKKAKNIDNKNEVVLVDFKQYTPSYEAPASFIASPVWDGNKKIGVAIFQMPIDRLNAIMGDRVGLGESGESYLVGSDGWMRSDSLNAKEKFSVVSSFRAGAEGKVTSPMIAAALEGKSGFVNGHNYLGTEVFASYQPLEVLGHRWALIVEESEEETFRHIASLDMAMFIIVGLSALATFLYGFFFARSLGGEISEVSKKLASGAKALATMAHSLQGESVKLSEAGNEQASSLQETAASIDEISAMVERNSDSASNAASISKSSDEAARDGKKKVGEMIASIGQISSKQDEVNHHLNENNKKMEEIVTIINQIADKTKVINDIVFQTKLLSFNASVEAARAGEHGKGFAVVAEEVGNLASMSGKAADEISSMLESSTNHVQKIMSETKTKLDVLSSDSKKSIESGEKVAKECGMALDQILSQVALVNDKVQEIATASAEQSSGVREVNTAMGQLDQVTQQNTVIAQDASVMSQDLSKEVESLNEVVKAVVAVVEGKRNIQGYKVEAEPEYGNLHQLSKHRKELPSTKSSSKNAKSDSKVEGVSSANKSSFTAKVVGLDDQVVPSSDDDRFEDL
ncbi:hypothetical protein GW915_07525 [bacterium]|nr:hypothetical protein [bacterium]